MNDKEVLRLLNGANQIYLIDEDRQKCYTDRECKAIADRMSMFGASLANDGIAYVPVVGAIGTGFWDYEATDYQTITSNIARAEADDSVKAIVLILDTPGGAVMGCFDACSYIKSCKKPVYAYVYGQACSAGYALASSCDKIYMAEDADTGCCGAYAHYMSYSEEAYKAHGIIQRIFRSKNAPKKNVSPLTDEKTAEEVQMQIDEIGNKYLSMVASNRGVTLETAELTFGQGAVVTADYAISNNMADEIMSIEEAIAEIKSTLIGGEGECMTDFTKMSAEEQEEAFAKLCEANPSLLADAIADANAKEAEAEASRIAELDALRDGSDEVNTVVDKAIADKVNASDITSEIMTAMKAGRENAIAKAVAEAKANAEAEAQAEIEKVKAEKLASLANETTTVVTAQIKSEDEMLDAFFGKENK